MKKSLLILAAAAITFSSCRKDDNTDTTTIKEPENITEQNSNDDKAIAKYMDEHYLDAQGKVQAFSSTTTADDNYTKLSAMNPKTLSSGVIVIVREGAQPDPGTAIGETDVIRLMHKTSTFLSTTESGSVIYASEIPFQSTVETTGVPQVDPPFYYTSPATITASGKTHAYYEIEGFQEGLKYFKSFSKPDSDNYNMQGVIIVPSRAAFARDEHYPYSSMSWRNRNFVFNFQVYKTTPRS